MLTPRLRDWLVPACLVSLHAPPFLVGAIRLFGLAVGRATMPEHERLTSHPVLLVIHILGATTFAMVGAFQFAPALRGRRLHRTIGRLIAPLGIVTALSGIGLAVALPFGDGDQPILRGLRMISGCAMLASIGAGLVALHRRDFAKHGAWMTRGYAVGAASGTQFFTVAPYVLLLGGRSVSLTALLMMLGWAINSTVAEWWLRRRRTTPRVGRVGHVAAVLPFIAVLLMPTVAQAQEEGDVPDEHARMKVLLDVAAESRRDKRISEGAGALGHGVIFAGFGVASWVTPSTPGAREFRDVLGAVLVGSGGLMMAGGAWSLLTTSEMERRHRAYLAALRERPEAIDGVTREAERALFAEEEKAKEERVVTGVASFVFGAAEIAAGIALEAGADDPGLRWLGRGLIVGGVGAGIFGGAAFAIRSEEERMADLWRSSRSSRVPVTRTSLSIVPRLGIGRFGIAGTF